MDKIGGKEWSEVKERFVEHMPYIEKCAAKAFSRYGAQRKEEMIHETVSNAWDGYCRAIKNGKNPDEFMSKIALRAIQRVKEERFVDGKTSMKDIMSKRCHWEHGVKVEPLPEYSQMIGTEVTEALADKHGTPAEIVPLKLDYNEYLLEQSPKAQVMITDMVSGYSTPELAAKNGVTPSAISQRRRRVHDELKERLNSDEAIR